MDPVRAAMETFVRLTAYNKPLPRISSQGIGITCIVTKFQFFSELESLFLYVSDLQQEKNVTN